MHQRVLILREICKRISLNPIPTQTIDFSLVNISQKTTSFARTRSGTKNSLKQKRGPFNSSSFSNNPFSNNPFAKTNASTATPIDRSSPFFHANWLNITRDQFILNAVQGFKICFRCTPVQSVVPRVSDQNSIIKNEIVSLLKKGAIRQVPFSHDGFLPQIVSCSEKRRRPEAGVRFECVKPVYRNRALQNGKFSNIEVSPQQGGLYDKFRPHRRLPDGPHASRLPKISSFSVGGQNLRIYSNAIRPKCGPQAVYKNHEAGCSLTEESRGSSDHLSRRHFNYSFFNRDVESPQNTSHQLARIPRFSNKLREVESNSIPTNCVLGNAGGFGVNAIHITPTESCTDSKRMSPPPKHKQANYSPFVSGPRASRGMSSSRMVCPTSLPSTTNSSDKRSSEMGELQRSGGFDTIGQIRPIMVGNDPTNPVRESNCSTNSRLNHLLGCFQTGVGGILGFPTDRRSLERERVPRPHKCIRTPGSILCPKVLSPDPNQQSHLSETRQYHSSLVPKQLGGALTARNFSI